MQVLCCPFVLTGQQIEGTPETTDETETETETMQGMTEEGMTEIEIEKILFVMIGEILETTGASFPEERETESGTLQEVKRPLAVLTTVSRAVKPITRMVATMENKHSANQVRSFVL